MRFRYSYRKMAKLFANSGDPDQRPCSAASNLGLHCLPVNRLGVSRLQWVNMKEAEDRLVICFDWLFTIEPKKNYYSRAKEKLHQNFHKVVVHMIVIDQWNHIVRLYEIQVRVIYSCAILVAVMSEFCVKRIIWKTWTGTLANSADPDHRLQNTSSGQGLHCLLKLQEVKV